jgi:hypothetical protein
MKTKFKEGVYGFIYDSVYGEVTKVFNKPLTESETSLVLDVLSDDDCLFMDINLVNELFEFNEHSLECDSEGLNEVLEFDKGAN